MTKAIRLDRQRGVALITAMLITALATIIVTGMKSREAIDIRRATNMQFNEQAFYYLLGAEDWAKHILVRDRRDGEYDNLSEIWAKTLPPVSIDGGQIGGQLVDLQGRFNINNLASAVTDPDQNQNNENKQDQNVDVIRFQRLLNRHELSPDLVHAVIDWIDPDINPRFPNGAEDNYYLQLEQPYRAANTQMAHPSELLRVKGFSYEVYEKLAPYLVAMPEHTPINVNTATPGVLQMIVEDLSDDEATALAESLKEEPVEEVTDFLNHEIVSGKKVETKDLSVKTEYFRLSAYAQVGHVRSLLNSTLHRESADRVDVLSRSREGIGL